MVFLASTRNRHFTTGGTVFSLEIDFYILNKNIPSAFNSLKFPNCNEEKV